MYQKDSIYFVLGWLFHINLKLSQINAA